GEARGNARELEGRLQEALPQRLAGQVVVSEACAVLVDPAARELLAAARVLGDENAAVVDERVARVALLDEKAESVSRAGVGGEVEVRGEDLHELEHQLRRLAALFDGVEEGTLHHAADRLDPDVRDRLGPADPPTPPGPPGLAGE